MTLSASWQGDQVVTSVSIVTYLFVLFFGFFEGNNGWVGGNLKVAVSAKCWVRRSKKHSESSRGMSCITITRKTLLYLLLIAILPAQGI
jgi:hypothetical protein